MTKSEKDTNAAAGDAKANNKKRSSAEEEEEEHPDSKTLKRAKPSVSKAAEELMCPILQDLPIDPVTAEDVSFFWFRRGCWRYGLALSRPCWKCLCPFPCCPSF